MVARGAAIFRVDEVIVYRDRPDARKKDGDLISLILRYAETPQYLRKHLYPLRDELQFAGILPPLRTPNHPVEARIEKITVGTLREGVIVKSSGNRALVDIGVGKSAELSNEDLRPGTVITVRIDEKSPLRVTKVPEEQVEQYWGYDVRLVETSLSRAVESHGADFVLATSVQGEPIRVKIETLRDRLRASARCLILFGSPAEGLSEILRREGRSLDELAGMNLNFIPEQGTETVRTEEALYSTLSIINVLT